MQYDQIKSDFLNAETAFNEIKAQIRNEKSEARRNAEDAISQKHKAARDVLSRKYYAAKDALRAANDQSASHPWEGKRVIATRRVGASWRSEVKEVQGLVEVVRSGTEFVSNMASYRRPSVGNIIIRQIKKDGTPSLKCWNQYHSQDLKEWKLVDAEQSA